jgi:hypothetical protein
MPRGSSRKREREYEELKRGFKKEGRYRGREKEVAARIVNKQRSQYGETVDARTRDRQGKSPDRDLPIRDYDRLTVDEIRRRLPRLSGTEVRRVRTYERRHKNRSTLLDTLERAG